MKKLQIPAGGLQIGVVFLVLTLAACSSNIVQASGSLATDQIADQIIAHWQGNYDNADQIAALREDGAPIWQESADEESQSFGGHLPVTAHYRRVSLPDFGERVLYLEETIFEGKPYRQRIYTVINDAENEEVRVKLWYFKDKAKYEGARQDLSRFATLSPDDMSPLPDECDLVARPTQDRRLHLKMRRCVFGDRQFDYQVILDEEKFWFRDRIADAETGVVTMTAGSFTYHKLRKTD